MKIVIINGQNHKGSSYAIGRMLAEKLAGGDEIVEFFLPRDLNHFCLGCYQCLSDEKKCPYYEEKNKIEEEVKKAELLLFTTPTYCMRASAPMKSYIDLNFINWMPHRPKEYMFHKKAVVIATAAGAGMKSAIKDITTCLFYCGVPYRKKLGYAVQATSWETVEQKQREKIETEVEKLSRKILKKGEVKPGFKTKFMFLLMRMSMKDQDITTTPMAGDYIYWRDNGWLGKDRPWK